MVDYNKRLVEVDEILNYLSDEEFNKIPADVIDTIRKNKDENYVWEYDENKSLDEQDLNRDTIIILSYLNMEYLLNDEQKNLMNQIHQLNDAKDEKAKENKYNTEDIFKGATKKYENVDDFKIVDTKMAIYKESIFVKIINKIKSFFN